MFVDRVQIEVIGGKGGKGCLSFWREKYVERGGPDGGNGGNGGNVIIRAEAGVNNLAALAHQKHCRGTNGMQGLGSDMHGKNAPDFVVLVPPGTMIIDAKTQLLLKDLVKPGDEVIAAHGGYGGKGNAHFKSATNRAPRDTLEPTEPERRVVILELKVIADVGLIGKPNAGKSTLLSRLSRARPEIASYPFTTKHPNLGIVHIDAERSFALADLPGLIEGASHGVGLGHEFLRHIERAGILVHLVEPLPMDGSDPLDNYRTIRNELEQYAAELGNRPEIVAVSKCEIPEAAAVRDALAAVTGGEVLSVSAATGAGLDVLLRKIGDSLTKRDGPVVPLVPRVPPHVRDALMAQAAAASGDDSDASVE